MLHSLQNLKGAFDRADQRSGDSKPSCEVGLSLVRGDDLLVDQIGQFPGTVAMVKSGNCLKMDGADASVDSTEMMNLQTLGDISKGICVGESMGFTQLSFAASNLDNSVALAVLRKLPDPAVRYIALVLFQISRVLQWTRHPDKYIYVHIKEA